VALFIDRLPLYSREILTAGRRRRVLYPLLPAVVSEPSLDAPPPDAPPRWWKFDTACAPDACAWRFHLESAGLYPSPPDRLAPQQITIRTANDTAEELPTRRAAIWLVSNIPSLRRFPFPLDLRPGLPFYDRSPRRTTDLYPLLGMGALHRARLRVQIDFAAETLSVRTPGAWYRGLALSLRRRPGRFATIPADQLCAAW
jgi:hypothetical protein